MMDKWLVKPTDEKINGKLNLQMMDKWLVKPTDEKING